MTTSDLLEVLREGLENGRIAPHLAAYIAAEVLGIDAEEADLEDTLPVKSIKQV